MTDHDPGSEGEEGASVSQAFSPIQPSRVPNHVVDSQHVVHSVVPDLMRVYESLTKGNPHNQQHQETEEQQQQQQEQDQIQEQQRHFYQHHPQMQETQSYGNPMNYTFITSEEQYHQLYNSQGAGGDPYHRMGYMPPMHYLPPPPGQQPSSLPFIPPPLTQTPHQPELQRRQSSAPAPAPAPKLDDDSSKSSSKSYKRRRSNDSTRDQESSSRAGSTSGGGGGGAGKRGPKSRRKSKETDGRWSKRFTWPDELHRDFVSAVFDVGLKHSSPSTILEHMPKHPQITSERVKSHLQKYRLHRAKSKQEFMSSYESSLKKFKAGEMDTAKTLGNGEAAAQLSHATITDVAVPSAKSKQSAAQTKEQKAKSAPAPPPPPQPTSAPPPSGHEALMLPKLTEVEKNSPIGASMGYLLGLFFSLKKQLLIQRSVKAAEAAKGKQSKKASAAGSEDPDKAPSDGPVAAVYNSFVDASAVPNVAAMPHPTPVIRTGSMEWSGNAPDQLPPGAPLTAAVPNPVVPPQCTGSTRNNLEASSMMKREMQNQMAFQNKMRALKQQELNKYKDVSQSSNNQNRSSPDEESGQKQDKPSAFAEHKGRPNPDRSHRSSQTPHQQEQQPNEQPKGGEETGDEGSQGAGEAVAGRAREPSFSVGGSEEFWNGDVMDDQLFEFLMNN